MNIFVASLNFKTEEDALRNLFEGFGTVDSVKIIMDRETGRSKGFGFVEMPNDEEGQNAIETLNESEFENRNLVVKEARPREPRQFRPRY
jgi:RNA recognition motif-containing protein